MQNTDADTLRRFVRDGLGCTCPDAVLRSIEVEANPAVFADLGPGTQLIKVGGRLLVLVVRMADGGDLSQRLAEWFARGRALREREGWNRFRLVVAAADPAGAGPILTKAFDDLGLDDRLHLHVIAARELPDL